jgi:hypothetical protein
VPDKHAYNEKGRLLTNAAPQLAGRLVEPGLDMALPIFFTVAAGDNVVVLHHFAPFLPAHDHVTEANRSAQEQNNAASYLLWARSSKISLSSACKASSG